MTLTPLLNGPHYGKYKKMLLCIYISPPLKFNIFVTANQYVVYFTNNLTHSYGAQFLLAGTYRGKTDVIILYFSKAFDKVLHDLCYYKLQNYGIRGNAKEFYHRQSQKVVINGKHSR